MPGGFGQNRLAKSNERLMAVDGGIMRERMRGGWGKDERYIMKKLERSSPRLEGKAQRGRPGLEGITQNRQKAERPRLAAVPQNDSKNEGWWGTRGRWMRVEQTR